MRSASPPSSSTRPARSPRGRPSVTVLQPAPGIAEDELLRLAAAAERGSEHPLAEAIVRHAAERGIATADAGDFEAIGRAAASARPSTARRSSSARARTSPSRASTSGDGAHEPPGRRHAGLGGAWTAAPIGVHRPRRHRQAGVAEAVRRLQRAGLEVWMLTGDRRETAEAIGAQVGIGPERIVAEVLPADKAAEVDAAAGRRRDGRDGRRRDQRRAGAGPGRPRHRHRHRRRRGHRGIGRHAPGRRPRRRAVGRAASRARRCGRSARTSAGPSATTSSSSRWRPACSTRWQASC